ncbi:MAG: hypothetical protein LBG06_00480 [Deltaproteobacteria bacterium]|jgi:hypothetical protein|nr:hypothetical protein [Deltaproteobacteria bacterium]
MSFKSILRVLSLSAALALPQAAAVKAAPSAADAGGGTRGEAAPGKPRDGSDDVVGKLSLAARLAVQGRKANSPIELAAAAEIYATNAVKDAKQDKTSEGGAAPAAGAEPVPFPDFNAADLFAEAAASARSASDETLAAAIEQRARNLVSRPPVYGRGGRHRDRVNPHTTDVYKIRFRGGELARATVIADDGYDLDLFVYGDDGALVAYANDGSGISVCSWAPDSTRIYTLKVNNTTDSFVGYLVYTN